MNDKIIIPNATFCIYNDNEVVVACHVIDNYISVAAAEEVAYIFRRNVSENSVVYIYTDHGTPTQRLVRVVPNFGAAVL